MVISEEVLDPPGGQVADPPNRQGFASNSPHSSACQQLSCSPPPFPAPPKMRPKPTCPIPNPCQHGRAFCSSPPQIFCPRPKPHVSPLVGLLASAQIWLVVIYNGRVEHQLEESFPTEPLMIVPCGRNALLWELCSLWEECSLTAVGLSAWWSGTLSDVQMLELFECGRSLLGAVWSKAQLS